MDSAVVLSVVVAVSVGAASILMIRRVPDAKHEFMLSLMNRNFADDTVYDAAVPTHQNDARRLA